MFKYWFIVSLVFLSEIKKSKSDICITCTCLNIDTDTTVNCHDRELTNNSILHLELTTLNENNTLKHLILSKNNITVLPENIFVKLKHLKSLNLFENLINEIHVNLFIDSTALEDLNFSNNQLKFIDNELLNAIPSLLKLNLSYNNIDSFTRTTENITTKLTFLDLSHNNITHLNNEFMKSLLYLNYLDLSFNNIKFIDENVLQNLRHLRIFRVTNNHIVSLSNAHLPMTLKELHCGFNKMKELPYGLHEIEILNIENNLVSKINNDLKFLRQLELLNVDGNILSDFPNVKLQNLKILHISNNNLSVIPQSISTENFPMLNEFNINGNSIQDIKFNFGLKLCSFSARNMNSLEAIHKDTFLKLEVCKEDCINITISDNKRLHFIHEEVFKHLNICFLDLSNNNIDHISPKLIDLKNKSKMTYGVNLQGNPFNCNCSLQWMLNELVPQLYITKPILLDNLRCATPPPLSNTRMVHWYKWQEQVFCADVTEFSSKMITKVASVSTRKVIFFETSTGLLIVLTTTITLLAILVTIGILLSRRIARKRTRINRRF